MHLLLDVRSSMLGDIQRSDCVGFMALASSDWDCLLIAVELITHHVHEEHNILVSERFRHYSIALPKVKKAASVVLLTAPRNVKTVPKLASIKDLNTEGVGMVPV